MKLSTKILFGFLLTNTIYLLLLAAIFMIVRPLDMASQDLIKLIVPIYDNSADIRFNVAELRSNMRAYAASPDLDHKIFETASDFGKSASGGIDDITKILSDPRAEFLRTPEITGSVQKMLEHFKLNTQLLTETPPAAEAALKLRMEYSDIALEMLQTITEVMRVENDMAQKEFKNPTAIARRYGRQTATSSIRGCIYESWIYFLQGCLRSSQEHFDKSLTKVNEALDLLGKLIDDTKVPAVREALEKARKTMTDRYSAQLKKAQEARNAYADLNTKRQNQSALVLEAAQALSDAVQKAVGNFTDGIAASVTTVNVSMGVGAAIALIVSLCMSFFLTRSIMSALDDIINHLNESAHEVDTASGELTSAANSLAGGVTENAASLEETSSALEELSSMTKRNADNATEAKTLMAQANDYRHRRLGLHDQGHRRPWRRFPNRATR